jgi:hypothetical protein
MFVMAFGLEKTAKICYTFAAWISKRIINLKLQYYEQQKIQIRNAAGVFGGNDLHCGFVLCTTNQRWTRFAQTDAKQNQAGGKMEPLRQHLQRGTG